MHTVIAVGFAERAQAYEALSRLKVAGFEGRVGVRSAVLVERDEEGRVTVPEEVDEAGGDVLADLSRSVPRGGTALVAELDERAVEVVDATMAELDGTVVRHDAAALAAEIRQAQKA
jgi:hypothetical protein